MKMKNASRGETARIVARIWQRLSGARAELIALFVLIIVSNLLALVAPMLSGKAVDAIGSVAGGVDMPSVMRSCALMLGCYAASSLLSYVISVRLMRLSQNFAYELRRDVFERLVSLPVAFFDTHQSGDIISRICYDIDTVTASLSTDILQVITSAVTVAGSLVMMLSISPGLSLVFAVMMPVTVLVMRWRMRVVHPLFSKRSKSLGELNGFSEQSISAQKSIRAYAREKEITGRFDIHNDSANEAYYKADYESCSLGPLTNFINNLSLALVSVFGALFYLSGALTLGNLSSFVLYSRKFSGPIREAADIMSELQAAASAAERVFALIDEEPETPDCPDAAVLSDPLGSVAFEDVRFSYDGVKNILSDVDINIPAGSTVAVVGPTGAGKTTVVNLLMRFYDTSGGTIRVDGTDVRSMVRQSLRLSYTMVLQDTWLFDGTVYENIAYGDASATMEKVVAAAKAARIHDFIMSLPKGYDTALTDDGVNISKGQKQLLTIARAMLADTRLLILDEATSNVDTGTEREVSEAMTRLMARGAGGKGEKTCFVIAHRLSTIENADVILVIDGGRIVERGTHRELIASGGVYARLYSSQFVTGE